MSRVKHVGCVVFGCGEKHNAHGYCLKHYMRIRRTGDSQIVRKPGAAPTFGVGYSGVHQQLRRYRGKASAHRCGCGRQAQHWAYDHEDPNEMTEAHGALAGITYSPDIMHYTPMCAKCHVALDRGTNGKTTPQPV